MQQSVGVQLGRGASDGMTGELNETTGSLNPKRGGTTTSFNARQGKGLALTRVGRRGDLTQHCSSGRPKRIRKQ